MFILVGALMFGVYFYFKTKTSNTTNPNTSIYQNFNPFGTSSKAPVTTTPDQGTTTTTGQEGTKEISRFHKITDFSVAGAVFLEDTRPLPQKETSTVAETPAPEVTTTTVAKGTKKTAVKAVIKIPEPTTEIVPSLRYVEKATGHVYQMYLDTKVVGKISNSTVPSVYETIFDGKGASIIYRYLSSDNTSITSFLASLGGKNSSFLASDITAISLSPAKDKFFSIIKTLNGSIGVTKPFDITKTTQVFSSPFSEWTPEWVTDKNVFLTTKPSYLVNGTVFNLDITKGTLSKIFGDIPGLTTLANNDGTVILYGSSLDSGPKLNIFNIKTHTSTDLNTFGLPEKCIWSNDNINIYCAIPNTIIGTQYPDYWYQGLVSFEDRFVKINTKTNDTVTLANSGNETPIDATQLFLSDKESGLFFINKKDGTLWSLDL